MKILEACLVAVYSDGRHRVGGDKNGHALGEGNDGTHESSEWPVIQHQPDLNITFSDPFNIADLTFLNNSNTSTIQQLSTIFAMFWPRADKSQARIIYIHWNENI